MRYFDVCNGDADGLIARHQYRLAFPVPAVDVTLITGTKRNISLLKRIPVRAKFVLDADISVFDVSYDQNAEHALELLEAGATMRYFDHHSASKLQSHPRLVAHIDTSANVCTSLIVDRHLNGAYRAWAICAAFGDNLHSAAEQLAEKAGFTIKQATCLRELGECLNYNAYGESVSDLCFAPSELAQRMAPYESPFEFVANEDILERLQVTLAADLQLARTIPPTFDSDVSATFILPDASWARRVSGAFANELASRYPGRAHAVLNKLPSGAYLVSIRAPILTPFRAHEIAVRFKGGGGREAAAGINELPGEDLALFSSLLDDTYRKTDETLGSSL